MILSALLALLAGATVDVPAGAPLAAALASARPGDVVRLGPGRHAGSLGRLAGIRVEGAGAAETVVDAPEGTDGCVSSGALELAGLTLRAGSARCALKVYAGGAVRLDDVALSGGSCGAFVEEGRLEGREVQLTGGFGLLLERGQVELDRGSARGESAAVAVLGGAATLRRFAITGPSREAGVTVARGRVTLREVVIRRPGPTGIAVSHGGRVDGVEVTVAGAVEEGGFLGDCAQLIRGTLHLTGATLVRCAGAAVEASGGELFLAGTDASGGAAGCIVLVDGASAELKGNLCAGRGPGLVAASGSRARLEANRWRVDPVVWVDCGSGARLELGRGESMKTPCGAKP